MYTFIVSLLLVLSVGMPILFFYGKPSKKRGKAALIGNLLSYISVFILAVAFLFTQTAHASVNPAAVGETATAAAFIAAGLVTGLCSIGTGIAVSSAASAAIGAISENENNFGKSMIFVAMAEGIAIYGLLISFMILGRV